ncbi:hypothetical protein DFH09DRAFT_1118951, partial [Mycena vulgaris]
MSSVSGSPLTAEFLLLQSRLTLSHLTQILRAHRGPRSRINPKSISIALELFKTEGVKADWPFIQSEQTDNARAVDTFLQLLVKQGFLDTPSQLDPMESPLSSVASTRPGSAMSGVIDHTLDLTLLDPTLEGAKSKGDDQLADRVELTE